MSTAFQDGDELPAKYTSDGADMSPPLAFVDVPARTRSLALVVDDPDAPDPAAPKRTWVHWVVFDLPPDAPGLREAVHRLPRGRFGMNDSGHDAWNGPAPPIGRHRYFFRLYALDRVLELEKPTRGDLDRAMAGHILAEATLLATYRRHRR